jgi:hypothetical protein
MEILLKLVFELKDKTEYPIPLILSEYEKFVLGLLVSVGGVFTELTIITYPEDPLGVKLKLLIKLPLGIDMFTDKSDGIVPGAEQVKITLLSGT